MKKYLDYLFIIALWLLIFGKNALKSMVFLDYSPLSFFSTIKFLKMNSFTYILSPLDLFYLILSPLNLLPLAFTLSILASMLVSFFFIKKLFREKTKLFSFAFSLVFFFNPFVYSRIMSGQLGVLLAYLFLPLYIYYLLAMLKEINIKTIIKAVLAFTFSSLFSIHFFAINFIIFIAASYFFDKNGIKNYLKLFSVFFLLLLLLSSFWLQGLFSSSIFSAINREHEEFFSPKQSIEVPAVAKIIGMWGFWREDGYITAYNLFPLSVFYTLLFILIALFIYGYYHSERKKGSFFFTLFWIGLILGVGISHPYTSFIFNWLFKNLPFFNGFRDSHKLVSLVALSYSFFLASAITSMKEKLKNKLSLILIPVFLAFILLYTFPLIFLHSQINPISYPQEYYQANNFLEKQNISGYIAYLPWQNYLTYNWSLKANSDGRISAPINNIVKHEVLVGSDAFGSDTELTLNITSCLEEKNTKCLEQLGVQYIIKDKCAIFPENYSWISDNSKAFESGCIEIHKINSKIEKPETRLPARFIFGLFVSLASLLAMIYLLIKYKQ